MTTETAIKQAKRALGGEPRLALGDSRDEDIRDALIALLKVSGEEMPNCECERYPTTFTKAGRHAKNCPLYSWENA